MAVDLHSHTTFSDGTLSPEELVAEALRQKLSALAVTDHDETGGCLPAMKAARDTSLRLIPGVELSIDYSLPGKAHMHVLGLFIDPENECIRSGLAELSRAREERAERIIRQLNGKGMALSIDELKELAGGGSIGRPHIATLMHRHKYVSSVWEAFDKYLAKGKAGYVSKKKLTFKEAAAMIHEAGGLVILAHPVSLNQKNYNGYTRIFRELRGQGLDGLEAYYSNHVWNMTRFLLEAA
ncbi:MAG TPA: PHP domain-containing protein, partial [Caldithrix abyssi]|nr:PHP domain-containing protein [Caldithrix abyssi]